MGFICIFNNINGHIARAVSQSFMRAQIVLLSKIFSRGVSGADVVGGAQIFYGVDGRARGAGAAWAYPLWEHRIFDGGHFMKG